MAVVQPVADDENLTEETEFMWAIVEGLRDFENGEVFSATETKAKFGIK
jgi:hypothetical protein